VELIPELELVIGSQPEVPALGPSEAGNRFGLLMQRFVQAFATAGHPLAIFLDDLQWADPASLKVLGLLLRDPDARHVLIVGAYRDNEVDAAHPLLSALDELRKSGATITELTLTPLDAPTVARLIGDTLGAGAGEIGPLSTLLFEKTQGNPFFLGQLIGALHEEGAIRRDAASGAWTWDLGRAREAWVTDNVVELMVGKLHRLPPATRRALELAACIGHEFELGMLATISRKPPAEAAADLWDALREGLVVPLDGDYRFFDAGAGEEPPASPGEIRVSYRFLHDRVLQAAYSLIEPAHREEVHLEIGRLLWAHSGEAARDEDLLDIVHHLNLGARGITGDSERSALARCNLRAGRRAKAAAAYQAAAAYFDAGSRALGDAGWEREVELSFALALEDAECAYLGGAPERAEARFEALLPRARSGLERARIHDLRVVLYTTLAKFADAVRAGREGLAALHVALPETEAEQQASFGAELAEAAANLGERRIGDLIDAPVMDDPERRLVLQLLCDMAIAIYFVSPTLYGTSVLKQVNISLKHGHSDVSSFSYMTYGFMLATMLGRPSDGLAFGRLSLALNDKLPNVALTPKLNLVFCGYFYLCGPLRASMPYYQKARETALESGDFVYLASAWYAVMTVKLGAGYQLDELREEVERGLAVTRQTKDATATAVLTLVRQAIASLMGRTRGRTSLSDDAFDEAAFCAALDEKEQGAALFYYHMFRQELLYLHGSFADAALASEEAEARSVRVFGMYYTTRVPFYASLSLLKLGPAATPEEARRREETVARHRARIADLAALSPANFEHQLLLVDAEAARASGRPAEAADLYDRAIERARENEFPHDEALANELCADLYLGLGKPKLGRAYFADAYLGYRHWGAAAKAEALAQKHPELLPAPGGSIRRSTSSDSSAQSASTSMLGLTTVGGLREAALIVRSAQEIAGETVLERIMERLVRIVLENAGAQRGALLLVRGEQLSVEATFGVEPEALVVGPSAPLESRSDLPQSVVLLVARTREPLVLDDAGAESRFARDPCIVARGTKSALCLPLLHHGRLSGVLYLEHNDASGAFNAARVELLTLLSSQAAIAVENAMLLASARAANDEVRRTNERLEGEVAERTEELRRSNRELAATNARLSVELSQREAAERERAALQAQVIDAQRTRLAELSTPLIPITDQIMVMPLIGSMDRERAAQVLDVALTGAQRQNARVVILDVTGLRHIDGHVVGTLLGTANALRLLGTEAVLTGIRSEVAHAMVLLDIDVGAVVTMGTLQSGIAYALRRVGRDPRGRGDGHREK
jgi:predicted ATPase/GAF domain-containing protein